MKPKTLVLLLLLLALFAGVIALSRSPVFKDRPVDLAREKSVFDPPPEDIRRVRIQPAEGQALALEKQDDEWRITEPVDAPADDSAATRLAETLAHLAYLRSFDPAGAETPSDEQTGLADPLWTVELTDAEGQSHRLLVGRQAGRIGGSTVQTYVRPEESLRTLLIGRDLAALLDRSADAYRNREIMNIAIEDIQAVRIVGATPLTLRKSQDQWLLTAPFNAPADNDAVNRYLRSVRNLSARRFLDGTPAEYGLDSPRSLVRLSLRAKETEGPTEWALPVRPGRDIVLRIGAPRGEDTPASVAGGHAVFALEASDVETLLPEPQELAAQTLLPNLPTHRIDAITIRGEGPDTLLQRDGETWTLVAPYAAPARQESVAELLDAAADLPAGRWLPAVHGADFQPRHSVQFDLLSEDSSSGPTETWTLQIGAPSPTGEMVFCRVESSGLHPWPKSVTAVRDDALRIFRRPVEAYWNRTLLDLPDSPPAQSLRIRRGDGEFLLTRSEGQWTLREPIEAKANTSLVESILSALQPFVAQRIVAVAPDAIGEYVNADDRIVLDITLAATDGDPPPTFRLETFLQDGEVLAWNPDTDVPVLGACTPQWAERLTGELRDPTVWTIQPEKVRAVELQAGSGRYTLRNTEGQWTCDIDPVLPIAPAAVEAFLSSVQTIRAERFVPSSQTRPGQYGLNDPELLLRVTQTDGTVRELAVSASGPGESDFRYARSSEVEGVFVLSPAVLSQLRREYRSFLQPPESETPPNQ